MFLRLFIALFITCLTLPAAAAETRSGARAGIAAVVNDDAVTFSDIRNRMRLYLISLPPNPPPEALKKIEAQTLGKLIDEQLQLQEAKRLGITVEEAQVESGIAQLANNNKMDAQQFEEKLNATGIKMSTLKAKIRAEIAWGMVVRRKLRPQINVSETEIDNEMNRLARGRGKAEYQVAEIFLPVTSAETESLTRQDAGKIIDQLAKGASFSQLARQFSKAPGAAQGGDLGWVREGQLETTLDEAIARLEPGQVSPPLKTEKGYHIMFVRDKRAGGMLAPAKAQAPAKPVKPVVTQAAAAAPAEPAAPPADPELHLMQVVMPAAPDEAQAVIAAKTARAASLKAEITSCDAMTAKATEYGTSDRSDLGPQKLESLPPDIRAAVAPLGDNELSAPVRTQSGIVVYMVCSRTGAETPAETAEAPAAEQAEEKPAEETAAAETPAPAEPAKAEEAAGATDASRDEVASQLGLKRLDLMAERYLKDLRATAYIEKRI